jgi:8-amino-7-oxononanoate synthase
MQPHGGLPDRLARDREQRAAQGLEREVVDPVAVGADFTSNDCLGLARDPALAAAAAAALAHGSGGRASRLLGGGSPLDREVERAAAEWLGAEEALLFQSGYHANLGALGALLRPGDVVLSDALNHASLVDGLRLARARVLVYRHADAEDLERRLAALGRGGAALVVTESVFSMDGDLAPLGAIAEACARHGAALVVDEAHAIGLLGPEGAGAWAALGTERARDPVLAARVLTGGKALGAGGALVVSSATVREQLVNRARTFAFTTALAPAVVGALGAGIARARAAGAPRARALELARRLARALDLPAPAAAVVPFEIGDADAALVAARELRDAGLHVRAVRPPTVPEGRSRLRLVCHAQNTDAELAALIAGLRELHRPAPRAPTPAARAQTLVVAGTDTGVGKTVVAALLARAAVRRGPAGYFKPVQTGTESDTETVGRLAGAALRLAEPAHAFALPASPHEAAAAAGARVDLARVERAMLREREALAGGRLVVELAGGLLVPWTMETLQIDWLARARLPLALVARSGLGTLNHTLLSLEALRARHLEPAALFLVGPPHESNRETLRRLGRVGALYEVPRLEPLDTASLDAWIDAHDLSPLFGAAPAR